MREIVIVSGKGGTGKTSFVASFAALAEKVVLADCDVDASNLHLVLDHTTLHREDFYGGKRAKIDNDICIDCGECEDICRFSALSAIPGENGSKRYYVDPIACEGCGVCAWFCPVEAIAFEPALNAQWFISQTRYGPLVHAQLGVAEENSGKLVGLVRAKAKEQAIKAGINLILTDGSPGIGCPVIASITGADVIFIVTESTVSGLHDLVRIADVAKHFSIPALVCINKWDINPEITSQIEKVAQSKQLTVVGRVRYDPNFTDAQRLGHSIVEHTAEGSGQDIRDVWTALNSAANLP